MFDSNILLTKFGSGFWSRVSGIGPGFYSFPWSNDGNKTFRPKTISSLVVSPWFALSSFHAHTQFVSTPKPFLVNDCNSDVSPVNNSDSDFLPSCFAPPAIAFCHHKSPFAGIKEHNYNEYRSWNRFHEEVQNIRTLITE